MTELTWEEKYKDGKKTTPIRIALPFQTIIWGDKKYVLPSLLPEFAGKVILYINQPFDRYANFSFTANKAASNHDVIFLYSKEGFF